MKMAPEHAQVTFWPPGLERSSCPDLAAIRWLAAMIEATKRGVYEAFLRFFVPTTLVWGRDPDNPASFRPLGSSTLGGP